MEPPSSGRIGVINESGRRLQTARIRKAAEAALVSAAGSICGICVLLTDDETVQELNKRFRGIDEPTDVLSFPAAPMPGAQSIIHNSKSAIQNPGPGTLAGDVAIAVPYAERQAKMRRNSLTVELQYLTIHGVLHLMGWEDETDKDRAAMQAEMARIGAQISLPVDAEWSSILHGAGVA